MKVAVAGGTGFVGRHVVEALRARGHSVIVLARGRRGVPRGAELVPCDLAREPVPAGALRGCDAVVNLAGIKREDGTQTFEAVHVEATRRLLAACDTDGVRRFVHVSVVCSRPDARLAYHDTKWRAEEAVRASGLDFTILKPAVIYGPGDDMVTHLVRMIRFAALFPVADLFGWMQQRANETFEIGRYAAAGIAGYVVLSALIWGACRGLEQWLHLPRAGAARTTVP